MALGATNIPPTGSGDPGPIPVATYTDASGNKHQAVIAEFLTGTTPTPVTSAAPLPVVQTGTPGLPTGAATQTTLAAVLSALGTPLQAGGNVVVTGTVPLPTGAATQTTLAAVLAALGGTLAVSGTFTSSGTTDVATTATITTTGSTTLTGLAGLSTLILSISSGTQSGVTDLIEGSNDGGTTWSTLGTTLNGVNTLLFSSLAAVSGNYMVQIGGYNQVRYRVAAITSGTYNIALRASAGATNTRTVLLAQGTNTIGALSPNQSVNVAQVNGTNTPTNNGVVTAGTQRVTIASDSTGQVKLSTVATGGLTTFRLLSAIGNNLTSVKGSAGRVCVITATNSNAAIRYVKLYDKASAPVLASDTPTHTLAIPPTSTGQSVTIVTDTGIAFATGIALATTTGVADTDAGSVAANEVIVHLEYA